MQLFYNSTLDSTSKSIRFSKEESKHIVKVLRKTVNNTLKITNGKGWLFSAKLINTTAKQCEAIITNKMLQPKPNYNLHLAVAPTKMNDRFEWFLEKATEIGITTITPLLCENSERKTIKHERYERILQSAMKQSLQCYLPTLNTLTPFKGFINQNGLEPYKYIAHCNDNYSKEKIQSLIKPNKDVLILIGPEGDFNDDEINLALENSYKSITLGNTRLRTETAAIVACHSVAFINI